MPILDHSLIEDMILCPIRALRYYLDKLEILDRGNMCYSSFSKMAFQEIYKELPCQQTDSSASLSRSDLETLNVSMAKAQNAPYMAGSHTQQF